MSSNENSRRCIAIKHNGEPCKAWAKRGAYLCVAHLPKPLETIDDVVKDSLRRQEQLSTLIEEKLHQGGISIEEAAKLFALHSQNAGRIGKLLRDQKALSGESADDLLAALGVALDEISTGLGIEV